MKRIILFIHILILSACLSAQSRYSVVRFVQAYYDDVRFVKNDNIHNLIIENSYSLNQMLLKIQKAYTVQSPQYAESVMWCAYVCVKRGDNVQSKRLLDESSLLFKQYGDGVFDGKDTLHQIFYLDVASTIEYQSERDYMAVQYARKSCDLKKSYFGEHSEVYLNALLDISRLYAERLEYRRANHYHNLGYNAYVELIKSEFCSTCESERTLYWDKAKTYIHKTISIAHSMSKSSHYGQEHSLASAAYNALLLSKGLLLNTSNSFENYVYNSGNKEAIGLLQQKKLIATQHASPAILDSMDYAILSALQKRGQSFELPHLSIHWTDVASKLNNNDLAIEFYRTENDEYGAILLKKKWKSPKVIKLKNFAATPKAKTGGVILSAAIDSLHPEQYDSKDVAHIWQVSRSIWTDEIVQYFPKKGDGRIYFSADGVLQITGIEYLPFIKPHEDGSYYSISDLFPMYRLSSTRELVLESPSFDNTDVAVYGGLTYNMNYAELKADAQQYPHIQQPLLTYSPREKTRDVRNVAYIQELEGALTEADSIVSIINNAPTPYLQATSYTGTKGTEASFKALQNIHPRLIHIATHGFFLSDDDAKNSSVSRDNNPMVRSGLLLAGAENAWFGFSQPDDVEDGILTALEISNIDFRGLDMVVMSACETGIGDIQADGVFGLQRGFKMAGTKSILMSLWKVDDDATCLLMTEFYRNWIEQGKTKHDALELAKQAVRSHTEKGWDHPKYWASFILLDAIE